MTAQKDSEVGKRKKPRNLNNQFQNYTLLKLNIDTKNGHILKPGPHLFQTPPFWESMFSKPPFCFTTSQHLIPRAKTILSYYEINMEL